MIQGELPGEYESDCDNCPGETAGCFKTKNWTYDADELSNFCATRNINNGYPYYLRINYKDGSIKCYDRGSNEYCTMLCGGNGCTLK